MSVVLPTLPYAFDALEPYISRRALATHYRQHHAVYVKKTRSLVEGSPLALAPLEEIVQRSAARDDRALFNAAAQAWNHGFLWPSMRAGGGGPAHGEIAGLIDGAFGNQSRFCEQFVAAAGAHFGSGWAWLLLDGRDLRIATTPDAETPLTSGQLPLLVVDIWEHAYYLDYQSRRPDYLAAVLANLVNWDFANQNLSAGSGARGSRGPRRESAVH